MYCQIPSWTINALLLLNIDAGHLFNLPELWSLEICSAWNLHGYTQQPWEWLIQGKKNCYFHWTQVTFWVVELQRQSRVTHCLWGGPRPAHVADALTQLLFTVREEATSSVSCTWARVWRLIYHYACKKGKRAILSRRNRENTKFHDRLGKLSQIYMAMI